VANDLLRQYTWMNHLARVNHWSDSTNHKINQIECNTDEKNRSNLQFVAEFKELLSLWICTLCWPAALESEYWPNASKTNNSFHLTLGLRKQAKRLVTDKLRENERFLFCIRLTFIKVY